MAKYTMRILEDGRRRVSVSLLAPSGRTAVMSRDSRGREDLAEVGQAMAKFAADVRSGKITGRGRAGEAKEWK